MITSRYPTIIKWIWSVCLTIILIGFTGLFAATCTCTSTCSLSTSTNWSCGAIPGAADDVICGNGCVLSIPTGTYTNNYLSILPGGAATVTGSPVVLNYNGPTYAYGGIIPDVFFGIGTINDNRGSFISSGKDLTINWTGAGTARMLGGPSGNSGTADLTTTNTTQFTLRGVERAVTRVVSYSRGTNAPTPDTNMVDCVDGATPPTGGAIGDTIVFTDGKSRDFWYEVTGYPDQCTAGSTPHATCSGLDATTECSATACNGGPCDYQITRNSTGSTPGSVASSASWSSMVLTTLNTPLTAAGGGLHATPMDSDANGVANGDGLLPTVGDPFVVFKPVLIQGGTNPILNGAVAWVFTGGYDWRYVELNKLSGNILEDCDDNNDDGFMPLWDMGSKITSAEGEVAFINLHNYASRHGAWEISYTDRPDDVRPNAPRVFNHVYIHDVDATVGTTCPGLGVQVAAPGVGFGVDDATRGYDGITYKGLHIARWGYGGAISLNDSGLIPVLGYRNVRFTDPIIHDWPGISGYGSEGSGIILNSASNAMFDGVSMWNIGQDGRPGYAISNSTGGLDTNNALVAARISNLFAVNIDSNSLATGGGGPTWGGVLNMGRAGVYSEPTHGVTVSSSYMASIIGSAAWGGRTLFSFIKDVVLEDDAAAPCAASQYRTAFESPVDVIGNVVIRKNALSCMEAGVAINTTSATGFTNRTRQIVSNVFSNMDSPGKSTRLVGLVVKDNGTNPSTNIDFYHNVVDSRGNIGSTVTVGAEGIGSYDGVLSAFYNIFLNFSAAVGTGFGFDWTAQTLNEGYNRFINVTASPANSLGNAASDVDSDNQDALIDPWGNNYLQLCNSPDKARNPWGGPVGPLRFGITSFNQFHPATIPLMDADAFKQRYNWLSCGGANQDAIPR